MNKSDKILILGGSGLVGGALKRVFLKEGFENILTPTRLECDLLNQSEVNRYFQDHKPQHVIDAAAKVGGIQANNIYRADFIHQNLTIQNNLFQASFQTDVETFLFLGSSCIYPKLCPQPIKEDYLLTGPVDPTNEPYAIAKIAGLKTAESFRRQYGKNYISLMPTNLYGVGDNFHPEHSHVIPGLIQRMHTAMKNKQQSFEIWGTGKPKREFLYVDDLALACLFVLQNIDEKTPHWMNVGRGEDISIADLATKIAQTLGYQGELTFNNEYPDGTPRKLLDVAKIKSLGWKPQIDLDQGLSLTVDYFKENLDKLRRI